MSILCPPPPPHCRPLFPSALPMSRAPHTPPPRRRLLTLPPCVPARRQCAEDAVHSNGFLEGAGSAAVPGPPAHTALPLVRRARGLHVRARHNVHSHWHHLRPENGAPLFPPPSPRSPWARWPAGCSATSVPFYVSGIRLFFCSPDSIPPIICARARPANDNRTAPIGACRRRTSPSIPDRGNPLLRRAGRIPAAEVMTATSRMLIIPESFHVCK